MLKQHLKVPLPQINNRLLTTLLAILCTLLSIFKELFLEDIPSLVAFSIWIYLRCIIISFYYIYIAILVIFYGTVQLGVETVIWGCAWLRFFRRTAVIYIGAWVVKYTIKVVVEKPIFLIPVVGIGLLAQYWEDEVSWVLGKLLRTKMDPIRRRKYLAAESKGNARKFADVGTQTESLFRVADSVDGSGMEHYD